MRTTWEDEEEAEEAAVLQVAFDVNAGSLKRWPSQTEQDVVLYV